MTADPILTLAWLALAHLVGIEQVHHREPQRCQHAVHRIQAEGALAVEKIGDVGLLKTRHLRHLQPGKVSGRNARQQHLAKSLL